MRNSVLAATSACASVLATMKSTPSRPVAIMLLTALHPAPPTPMTVSFGLSSERSNCTAISLLPPFTRGRCLPQRAAPRPCRTDPARAGLESLAQPRADALQVALRASVAVAIDPPAGPTLRFSDEQPGDGRERGTRKRRRQT